MPRCVEIGGFEALLGGQGPEQGETPGRALHGRPPEAGFSPMNRVAAPRVRGSARARTLLENWDAALTQFVKVMPKDYRKALQDMEAEALAAKTVAAE